MKQANITRQRNRQRVRLDTWAKCDYCNGTGLVAGMFSDSPKSACVHCNGIGRIPPDGEPLSEHEAILVLRKQLARMALAVRELKRRVASPTPPPSPADHYEKGRYNGD